jgi:hypothetical protein
MKYFNKTFLIIHIWFLLFLKSNIFSALKKTYQESKNNYYAQNYKINQIKELKKQKELEAEEKLRIKLEDEEKLRIKDEEEKQLIDKQQNAKQQKNLKLEVKEKIDSKNKSISQSGSEGSDKPSGESSNTIIASLEVPQKITLPENSPANTDNIITSILKYKYVYAAWGIVFYIFTLISKPKKKLRNS